MFNEVYLVNHLLDMFNYSCKWLVFEYSYKLKSPQNALGFTLIKTVYFDFVLSLTFSFSTKSIQKTLRVRRRGPFRNSCCQSASQRLNLCAALNLPLSLFLTISKVAKTLTMLLDELITKAAHYSTSIILQRGHVLNIDHSVNRTYHQH